MREEVHAQSSGFALHLVAGNVVSWYRHRCLEVDFGAVDRDWLLSDFGNSVAIAAMQQLPIIQALRTS